MLSFMSLLMPSASSPRRAGILAETTSIELMTEEGPEGFVRYKKAFPNEGYVCDAKLNAKRDCGRVGGLMLKKVLNDFKEGRPITDWGASKSTQKDGVDGHKPVILLLKMSMWSQFMMLVGLG